MENKKRVWCLYRVSGKLQVSVDDDIPVQRKACMDFVATKSDWEVTNELYEKGVSGWKKKAADRDEMNTVREGAINKEFDVLLVFMYDRIGRREDETPLVVQFLIEQGVEVWSVNEGQTKIEQHSDILINYIRFWQSSGESKKTSIRSREAKKQLSMQGSYQGGTAPYGYKIVDTDIPHWKHKDKMMKELVIDEKEAEAVKLVYRLYIDKHMGVRKIVEYLNVNGYRNRENELFVTVSIDRILKNPVYIGKKRYVSFDGKKGDTQPYNEKLRIISDDDFNMAQKIREARSKRLKPQDKSDIPLAGKMMFSGLAFCKCCGHKLISNYQYKNTKNVHGEVIGRRTVYRYYCTMAKGKLNHQQNTWGSAKYDEMALKKIKQVISQLDIEQFIETSVNHKKKDISQKGKNVSVLEKEIEGYKKQLEKLNNEIVKSLMGESNFKPDQLSSAIEGVEKKIQQANETLNNLLDEIKKEKDNYSDTFYIANELNNWENKFDNADNDLKKAMLSRIINKIHLGKQTVEIEFNLTLKECLRNIKRK